MIPMFSSLGLMLMLATAAVPLDWPALLAQYGVCGLWLAWMHFALKSQIERDDKRHADNQRMMSRHTEGLANVNLLLVATLDEMRQFSPHAVDKIVRNAGAQAQEAIRESRAERGENS